MTKYSFGIYLDSKIIGTALQIVSFFKNGVFDRAKTIVYIRKYKITAKKYSRIFKDAGIAFRFMRPSELDALTHQFIFYPFNAQSNCRFVANRKLTHIFITHGESNKAASVKPIIRIYDYIVSSGNWGIKRYLDSGIFTQADVDQGRLIKMGDTFIGQTGFSRDPMRANIICYAPTWEGGLEQENYSSVSFDFARETLLRTAQKLNVQTIVVKPHPNMGHRCPEYVAYLISTMNYLMKHNLRILIYGDPVLFSLYARVRIKLLGIKWVTRAEDYYPVYVYTDISAMETQCINERINYKPFYSNKILEKGMSPDQKNFYQVHGVNLDGNCEADLSFDSLIYSEWSDKFIGYSNEQMLHYSANERLTWLINYIKSNK